LKQNFYIYFDTVSLPNQGNSFHLSKQIYLISKRYQQQLKMNFHSFLIAVNQKVLYSGNTYSHSFVNVWHNVSHKAWHDVT